MKSFNGLYAAMMDHEEIKASILEAAKGKRSRIGVQKALSDLDAKANKIAAILESGKWYPPTHKRINHQERVNKKCRTIERPVWDNEQIVHHMLMRQFRKIVVASAYRYSCGFISGAEEDAYRLTYMPDDGKKHSRGRGPLFSARTMHRWVSEYGNKRFYVAELDVHKFYDSVNLKLLKEMLHKKIRDKRFLAILDRVIDGSGPGLPKGFYTSPWLANYYMQGFDYYVVQQLKPDHYLRFVDNLYVFSSNKRKLHTIVNLMELYLEKKLFLGLNDSKQVFRFEYRPRQNPQRWRGRAINAIGYVIHRNRITMRKSILKRARAKANRIHRTHHCRRIDAAAMLSYKGWFDHTDTYGYYQKWIKPKISMRYCRKRMSILAKRERVKI